MIAFYTPSAISHSPGGNKRTEVSQRCRSAEESHIGFTFATPLAVLISLNLPLALLIMELSVILTIFPSFVYTVGGEVIWVDKGQVVAGFGLGRSIL
jgi:hypothetical protein